MGEKFLSPHPQPADVTGHVPSAGSSQGTPQFWFPLCPTLAGISTEKAEFHFLKRDCAEAAAHGEDFGADLRVL